MHACIVFISIHVGTILVAKTIAKELFKCYNQGLLACLPMKDSAFLEVLNRNKVISDEVRNSLKQMDKRTERSSHFLDKIIKAGFDNGNDLPFTNLLSAMVEST